ncbi:chitin synthase-domain-containing protein [Armillaria fumosa]|nr:chitin synthase-domain-containing protein [Armillaria fumosa]
MLNSSSSSNCKRLVYAPSVNDFGKSQPDLPSYRPSKSAVSLGDRGTLRAHVHSHSTTSSGSPLMITNRSISFRRTPCFVTAYSESVEGLCTTLDSLATTDYPNCHKLILVIADGMVKGDWNDKMTPEICLSVIRKFSS